MALHVGGSGKDAIDWLPAGPLRGMFGAAIQESGALLPYKVLYT